MNKYCINCRRKLNWCGWFNDNLCGECSEKKELAEKVLNEVKEKTEKTEAKILEIKEKLRDKTLNVTKILKEIKLEKLEETLFILKEKIQKRELGLTESYSFYQIGKEYSLIEKINKLQIILLDIIKIINKRELNKPE